MKCVTGPFRHCVFVYGHGQLANTVKATDSETNCKKLDN